MSLSSKIACCCIAFITFLYKIISMHYAIKVLGPKLLLAMGYVKLGEKNCVRLPSVGEQTAN